ncbi:Na+:H+ antiporter, NhaC family [Halopelagius inordinatus]|uniref:Na+:H+ antiporter, NhaC family n=1 Tax=Halopelagius inordinatus TaxID=553467 RepID=A0A1I2U471_9EURY|nr:Na+:H+ antiporter, NhaC family [Halopelagius inordinatus]
MVGFEPRLFDDIDPAERPSLAAALVPIAGMIVFLSVGIVAFDLDPQFPLFWGIAFTGLFARYHLGLSWADLYEGISDGLLMGMKVILIMFTVYALIASWIHAGTIPSLMYYGLDLFTPAVFLPVTAVLSAVTAFAVGSSWTAAGTLGVALIGIGSGLGIPAPMTVGAILSGAYTGDKQSPLSDTTNLAAAVTNTDLYEHINAMRAGTLTAFAIAVALYAALGLSAAGDIPAGRIEAIQSAIQGAYTVSPVVFFPLILTFGLALYGIPALPALGAGVFAGVGTSILVQGSGFGAAWATAQSGTAPETGMELVNGLLQSGGLIGGAWIVTIAIAALSLGGMLDRTGVLAVLAHHLGRLCHGVASLTGVTALSAISMNILAAEQYASIVVPGMTLGNLYNEQGLETKNLSRAIEASGTTTSALIPWSSGGLFMAGTLGVPTLEYAPYYFFGFLSPLILLVMGLTGWQITFKDSAETAGQPSPTGGVESAAPGED